MLLLTAAATLLHCWPHILQPALTVAAGSGFQACPDIVHQLGRFRQESEPLLAAERRQVLTAATAAAAAYCCCSAASRLAMMCSACLNSSERWPSPAYRCSWAPGICSASRRACRTAAQRMGSQHQQAGTAAAEALTGDQVLGTACTSVHQGYDLLLHVCVTAAGTAWTQHVYLVHAWPGKECSMTGASTASNLQVFVTNMAEAY